jgi:hypothetical protein
MDLRTRLFILECGSWGSYALELQSERIERIGSRGRRGVYFGFLSRDGFDGCCDLLEFDLESPERRTFSRGPTRLLVDGHLLDGVGDQGGRVCW